MSKSVYILYLETNKYYIGSSSNPKTRIEQHITNNGTKWTKLYKPLKVINIIDGDELVEEMTTLEYMYMYGINNVRGGSFTTLNISDLEKSYIFKQICSIKNLCFKCNGKHHLSSQCSIYNIINNVKCLECGSRCHNEQHNTKQHNLTTNLSFPDGGFSVESVNMKDNSIMCYIGNDNELKKINTILEKHSYKLISNEVKLYGRFKFNQYDYSDDTYCMADTDDQCTFVIGHSYGGGSLENVDISIVPIDNNEYKLYLNWGIYYIH
jgi:hypothetical protein